MQPIIDNGATANEIEGNKSQISNTNTNENENEMNIVQYVHQGIKTFN